MASDYKSSYAEIIGREGQMYNEATEKNPQIKYQHYGIFANDNTYAVTFNPAINRPETKYFQHHPVRPPPTDQHTSKWSIEPPTSMTDGMHYIHKGYCKSPPLLPPYLNKPEDYGLLKGRAHEPNKGQIIYGPTQKVNVEKTVY